MRTRILSAFRRLLNALRGFPAHLRGLPGHLRGLPRHLRGLAARLRGGLAPALVAALAVAVLVAILLVIDDADRERPRGHAEFTMFPRGCTVDPLRRRNVLRCVFLRPGLYRVVFAKALGDGSPVISRGTCCPGRVTASVESNSTVLVQIPRSRRPVRASVFVP